MKRCPKCKTSKSRNEFHKSKTRKDGLQCHCKTCRGIAIKKWQKENRRLCYLYLKKSYDKKRKFYKKYKESLRCQQCGEGHSACLEFHHKNPKEKDFIIGQRAGLKSTKQLIEEIAKCDVLCANCHAKLHYVLKNKGCGKCVQD